MKTYLEDAEALDGLEFFSMAEAGEVAHWEILATLNETAKDRDVASLVKYRAESGRPDGKDPTTSARGCAVGVVAQPWPRYP
jgi:hypothetical protein